MTWLKCRALIEEGPRGEFRGAAEQTLAPAWSSQVEAGLLYRALLCGLEPWFSPKCVSQEAGSSLKLSWDSGD